MLCYGFAKSEIGALILNGTVGLILTATCLSCTCQLQQLTLGIVNGWMLTKVKMCASNLIPENIPLLQRVIVSF